jgi:hypothetical protein
MGRVVDESLRVMGGVRGLRVVDTAAALSSCGGSDEWCSAAIAEKVRFNHRAAQARIPKCCDL